MNITRNEKKENSTVELVIEVNGSEWNAALDKAYNKQRKKIMLPGWRKGKAPRKMVEAMYGAEIFYEDAIEQSYPDAYDAAIQEAGIEPVATPNLSITRVDKDGFSFQATVTVKPEATVRDYKGMTAQRMDLPVTDEELDARMEEYIDRVSRLVSVEREACEGDTVVIDFAGFKDGEPIEGGKADNYSLELGSGTFIPGFEEQLEGMSAGDERELNLTFPEDYPSPELAGAPVVFKVKLHEVKELQTPEIDDEFAKDVSEFDTLEEFQKSLRDELEAEHKKQADSQYESALLKQLVDNMECDVPDAMVEYQADLILQDYDSRIRAGGSTVDEYLKMTGSTRENMRSEAKEAAARNVRITLALGAVADAENIEATDEDVDAEIERMAKELSLKPEQVRSVMDEKEMRSDLRLKKAIKFLVETSHPAQPESHDGDQPEEHDGDQPEEAPAGGESDGKEAPGGASEE